MVSSRARAVFGTLLSLSTLACGDDDPHVHDATVDVTSDSADTRRDVEVVIVPCTVTAPTSCPAPAPGYADVATVIADRCLTCHDGKGKEWPLTTYDHVAAWADQLRSEMLACSMPPPEEAIPMTTDERTLLLTWIRCGLPP